MHYFENAEVDDTLLRYCRNILIQYLDGYYVNSTDFIYNKVYHLIEYALHGTFKHIKISKEYKHTIPIGLFVLLTDILRFFYLYFEGGIYVDCDTFPIKPFDDKLLSLNQFRVHNDIYFMGCQNNLPFQFTSDYITQINYKISSIALDNIYTREEHERFNDGTLKYESKEVKNDYQYIRHFCNRTWK